MHYKKFTNRIETAAKFLASSHLWISICSFCFILQTYLQLQSFFIASAVLPFVFFAVLSTYQLADLASDSRPYSLLLQNKHIVIKLILLTGSSIICLATLPFLHLHQQILVCCTTPVTLLYVLPLKLQKYRLIRIGRGLAKISVLTFVWSANTVLLPAWGLPNYHLLSNNVWFIFFERSLFVFCLSLLFDLRDAQKDHALGIDNLPYLLGTKLTRYLIYFCLFGLCVVGAVYYIFISEHTKAIEIYAGLLLSYVFLGWLTLKWHQEQPVWYYTFWIDGLMVFQFLFVWLFCSI